MCEWGWLVVIFIDFHDIVEYQNCASPREKTKTEIRASQNAEFIENMSNLDSPSEYSLTGEEDDDEDAEEDPPEDLQDLSPEEYIVLIMRSLVIQWCGLIKAE